MFPKVEQVVRLESGIHWLHPAGLIERKPFQYSIHATVDHPIHSSHILREPAASRLITCRYSDLFVDRALCVKSPLAVKAMETGNMVKDCDPVTYCVSGNTFADCGNDPCRLVAVDARGRQKVILDLLQIR